MQTTCAADEAAIPDTFSNRLMARVLAECGTDTVIAYQERTQNRCVIVVQRPGRHPKPVKYEYTMADALIAGKLEDEESRSYYRRYPRRMLARQCFYELAEFCFPDVTIDGETLAQFIERNEAKRDDAPALPGSSKTSDA